MYQPSGVFSGWSSDSPRSAGATGTSAGGMDGTVWVKIVALTFESEGACM